MISVVKPIDIFTLYVVTILCVSWEHLGLPFGSADKEYACNEGDLGLIPGLGRFPGEGKATHSIILAWRIPWTT